MKTRRFAEIRPRGCTCRHPWQVCAACAGIARQLVPVTPAQETPSAQRLLATARAHLVPQNVREIEERLDGRPEVTGRDVEQALVRVGEKREGL